MSQLQPTKAELNDLFWRALWTFGQAFTGGLIVSGFMEVDTLTVAAISGAGAALSVAKSFFGQKLGKDMAAR